MSTAEFPRVNWYLPSIRVTLMNSMENATLYVLSDEPSLEYSYKLV
jgi:hypothetical protein